MVPIHLNRAYHTAIRKVIVWLGREGVRQEVACTAKCWQSAIDWVGLLCIMHAPSEEAPRVTFWNSWARTPEGPCQGLGLRACPFLAFEVVQSSSASVLDSRGPEPVPGGFSTLSACIDLVGFGGSGLLPGSRLCTGSGPLLAQVYLLECQNVFVVLACKPSL